jgi:HEAT repeat protein
MRELGTNSVPIVIDAFKKENGRHDSLLQAIWRKSPPFLRRKIPQPASNRDLSEVAREVASGLQDEHRREVARSVMPHLRRVFEAARGPERSYVLAAFIRDLEPDAEVIAPTLARAISDPDLEVRKSAAFLLMEYGSRRKGPLLAASVAPLANALKGSDVGLRSEALRALGQIGPTANPALAAVEECLEDPNLRIDAAYALWYIDRRTKVAIEVIPADLNNGTGNAAYLLGQIGPAATSAVPALVSVLTNNQNNVRFNSCRALWQIDRQQAKTVLPVLIEILRAKETHPVHLAEAMKLVGEIGPEASAALPAIRELENHPDATVSTRAAEVLKKLSLPTNTP